MLGLNFTHQFNCLHPLTTLFTSTYCTIVANNIWLDIMFGLHFTQQFNCLHQLPALFTSTCCTIVEKKKLKSNILSPTPILPHQGRWERQVSGLFSYLVNLVLLHQVSVVCLVLLLMKGFVPFVLVFLVCLGVTVVSPGIIDFCLCFFFNSG